MKLKVLALSFLVCLSVAFVQADTAVASDASAVASDASAVVKAVEALPLLNMTGYVKSLAVAPGEIQVIMDGPCKVYQDTPDGAAAELPVHDVPSYVAKNGDFMAVVTLSAVETGGKMVAAQVASIEPVKSGEKESLKIRVIDPTVGLDLSNGTKDVSFEDMVALKKSNPQSTMAVRFLNYNALPGSAEAKTAVGQRRDSVIYAKEGVTVAEEESGTWTLTFKGVSSDAAAQVGPMGNETETVAKLVPVEKVTGIVNALSPDHKPYNGDFTVWGSDGEADRYDLRVKLLSATYDEASQLLTIQAQPLKDVKGDTMKAPLPLPIESNHAAFLVVDPSGYTGF